MVLECCAACEQSEAEREYRLQIGATQLVHEVAGTSGIREEQPFERLLRDVHTLQQNAFIAQNRYESVGKVMLGRDSDWPFFYL